MLVDLFRLSSAWPFQPIAFDSPIIPNSTEWHICERERQQKRFEKTWTKQQKYAMTLWHYLIIIRHLNRRQNGENEKFIWRNLCVCVCVYCWFVWVQVMHWMCSIHAVANASNGFLLHSRRSGTKMLGFVFMAAREKSENKGWRSIK